MKALSYRIDETQPVAKVTRREPALLKAIGTHLLVLSFFGILSVVMTYPLTLHFSDSIVGAPWDNFVWLYDLWWLRHSLLDLGAWPTFNPEMFHPFGYDLGLSEMMLANKLLALLPLLLFDEVVAYNFVVLLSFVLSGWATYLFVRYLTGNQVAGLIAGVVFAFSPFRIHILGAGWLPLISTQWVPLTFLYLERTVREGRMKTAGAAGLFFALIVLSSWYYAFIIGTAVGLYLLWRLRPWRERLLDVTTVRLLVVFGLVAVFVALPSLVPALSLRGNGVTWSIGEIEKWSACLDDFFLPNIYHPVWGEGLLRLRSNFQGYPWYVPGLGYLGVVPMALAALALWRGRDRVTLGFALLAVISFTLALGTTLHVWGERVYVPVPSEVQKTFDRAMYFLFDRLALNHAEYYLIQRDGNVPVPLPGLLVYLFVPFASAMRTMYRFAAVTTFAVAVLTGMGAGTVLARLRFSANLNQGVLGMALLVLVLFEFAPMPLPFGRSEIGPQPTDTWLRQQSDGLVVMQFPLVRALNGSSIYRSKYHGKKMAYGHGTFYPPDYLRSLEILSNFPGPEAIQLLRRWNVDYVLVGSRAYDAGFGDVDGQRWVDVMQEIENLGELEQVAIIDEVPFWKDERMSSTISGSLPVDPIIVDQVYVYKLKP